MAQPAMSAEPTASSKDKLTEATASPGKALSKGTVLSLGKKSGSELYIVQLEDAAAPTRGTVGKGASLQKAGDENSYVAQLEDAQADLTSEIRGHHEAAPQVKFSYTHALNGIAVELTRDEALEVSELDGVAAVQVDEERAAADRRRVPSGSAPPASGTATTPRRGDGTKGEGVVVGVLDTGINAANPSFADAVSEADGGDGYDHTNPFGAGSYVGVCDPATRSYIADLGLQRQADRRLGLRRTGDGTDYDDDGHGTHTASTTAGNQVDATTYAAEGTSDRVLGRPATSRVSRPHANVIAYDVCDGGCPIAAIIAGIDQAIDDGVDVINYSIGSAAASARGATPTRSAS